MTRPIEVWASTSNSADRLDLFAEEFDPHQMQRLPGKDINDPAPQSELPALEDLRFGLVAGRLELCRESRQIELISGTDLFRPDAKASPEAALPRRATPPSARRQHRLFRG